MKFNFSLSRISIIVILTIMTLVSSNLNWGKENWKGIMEADAKGYYAYLPAIFIYNDLNFGFFDKIEKEKYYNENFYYDYRAEFKGKVIDKYYCGTAVAEAPFFIIAHFLSQLSEHEADGYSRLYPIWVNIAALFYLLIGLIFLRLTLKLFEIIDWHIALTLLAAVFGTNLFIYTAVDPGMSHVFSFAFISVFLYYSKLFFSGLQKKHIVTLGMLFGMIVLIRPVNGLIIFALPFIAGSFETFKMGFLFLFRQWTWSLYGLLGLLGILSIQLILYKISTGSYFIYSYGVEGFNFLDPHFFDILFSYKKGLFLYTPLYLFSLLGIGRLWKKSQYQFFTFLGFFLLITYIFSSWWMWYYGGSFSSRVFVEYISLFMVSLALALKAFKSKLSKYLYITGITLLIVLCQIQSFQFRYSQIHWEDMTKEKYWEVFMRIDKLI